MGDTVRFPAPEPGGPPAPYRPADSAAIPEEGIDVRRVVEAAYRRRRVVMVTLLVAIAAATGGALVLPRTFMARTAILVQPAGSMSDPSPRPTTDMALVENQVDTLQEFIKSSNFLVPTLKRLGMIADGQTGRAMDQAVRVVQSGLAVRPTGASTFEVTYTGLDPVWPVRIVDGVISAFIDISTRSRTEQNDEAIHFLEGQIADYRERMSDSQRTLREFQTRNAMSLAQEPTVTGTRLSEVQKGLVDARMSAMDAQMRIGLTRRQMAVTPTRIQAETTTVVNPRVSAFEGRLAMAAAEYQALRSRYTDEHPEVKAKRREVEGLQAQLAQARHNPTSTGSETTRINPAYEKLKEELLAAENQLNSAKSRETAFSAQMGEARNTATTVPIVRQRFEQLQAEAHVQESLFSALMERVEQARLANQMAGRQQDAMFRLIDPARLVPSADGTRRLAIILAGAAVGLILGLTLAGIQETTDRRVRSVDDLERALGVPVLAAIPLLPEMPHHLAVRRRRRLLVLKTAVATLLVGILFVLGSRSQMGKQFIRDRAHATSAAVKTPAPAAGSPPAAAGQPVEAPRLGKP